MIKKLLNGLLLILISFIFLSDEVNAQEEYTFSYTGDYQEFIVPKSGYYQVELWGAQGNQLTGNSIIGGAGAYTKGTIWLKEGQKLYVYVGEQRNDDFASFNAGSVPGKWKYTSNVAYGKGGGGATDIRLVNGVWNDFNSLKSRIMVAGGGGGASNYVTPANGGYAGGLIGGTGINNYHTTTAVANIPPTGGTQTSGGLTSVISTGGGLGEAGTFGVGGNANMSWGSGGGGGYYGGGGGSWTHSSVDSGAGGSSFISGHEGSDAISQSSTSNNIIHTGQSHHYSGYVFTDTVMLAGNEVMPTQDGTSTMTGNTGDGYAKITYLPNNALLSNFNAENVEITQTNEFSYEITTPTAEVTTTLNATLKSSNLYVIGLGKVTLTDAEPHYVIAIDENGNVNMYTFNITSNTPSISIDFTEIDFDFDKNNFTYELTVPYYVTKLTENVSTSNYTIIGNDSLKVGKNTITISISENNKSLDYTFTVTRQVNATYEYKSIRDYQTFVVPVSGYYQIELWGAQGSSIYDSTAVGGKGAYTKGTIYLEKDTELYIYVGEGNDTHTSRNETVNYNAGSTGGSASSNTMRNPNGYAGGGATDIRLISGNWNDFNSLKSRIMVAGGGGGAQGYISGTGISYATSGGYGGSLVGGSAINGHGPSGAATIIATGGTQTSGGATTIRQASGGGVGTAGGFGYGGNGNADWGSGGGGGYYGGGGGGWTNDSVDSGAGGSSYISGHDGSDAISADSTATNIIHTGQSEHYSGYVFTDTVMLAGNEEIPTYDGKSTMTGNSGNGFAKITYIPESTLNDSNAYLSSLTTSVGTLAPEFAKETYDYTLALADDQTEIIIDATPENIDALISGLGTYDIAVGDTNITITVTATDGTILTYNIKVTRAVSSNPYLKGFLINGQEYEGFQENVFDYEIKVPYYTEYIYFEGIKGNENQKISSGEGLLILENNEVTSKMLVVSELGQDNQYYTVKFVREKSTLLKSALLEELGITIYFEEDVFTYDINIPITTHFLTLDIDPYYDGVNTVIEGNKYIGENSRLITITSSLEGLEDSIYQINLNLIKQNETIQTNFPFTGDVQTFEAPSSNYYNIEAWGAQGNTPVSNRAIGGKGAYTKGMIWLEKGQKLYIYVGEYRRDRLASFNAGSVGGNGIDRTNGGGENGYGGGGASDIRLVSGEWNSFDSLKSRIMVAGGGGGANDYAMPANGGYAGGLIGGSGIDGRYSNIPANIPPSGGTQVSGGATTIRKGTTGEEGNPGSFGIGGNGDVSGSNDWGSGGGGGYYGGGGGGWINRSLDSGAGGSSFISGHNGSDAILESSTQSNIIHTGKSTHYSGYVFTNTVMIDGAGYSWTDVVGEQNLMPNPNGGYYALGSGHTGNGYVRISTAEMIPNDNYLDTLSISTTLGEIDIKFAPWIQEYNVDLLQNENLVTIDASPKDILATLEGTGQIDVPPLKSTQKITVTAQDGSIRIYTINFNREASNDSTPMDIKINKLPTHMCNLSAKYCDYTFDINTDIYTITLPINIREIELLPVLRSEYQSYEIRKVTEDESTVLNSGVITLDETSNTYEVEVIAEDGINTSVYTYNFVFDPKSNNNLASLKITEPAITIENFNKYTYEYYVTLPSNISSYKVEAIAENTDAKVNIEGNTLVGAGITDCVITVTAPIGTTKTYIIHAYKEQDYNVYLSSLSVKNKANNDELGLVPVFDKLLNTYTINVSNDVKEVVIQGDSESTDATVTGLGTYTLTSGVNTINIDVINEGVINTYQVNIIKEKNSNPDLSNIEIDGYTLDPVFDKDITEYYIYYPSGSGPFDVTITPVEETTTYRITGNKLNPSKIVITSIAEDKSYKVYTIYTYKELVDNNLLKDIEVSYGSLDQEFKSDLNEYTMTVPSNINSIEITGILDGETSVISGNGVYSLVKGENIIKLVVTSATGEENIYTITITRKADNDATLKSVTNNQNSEVSIPEDTTLGYDYLINVQYEVNQIEITGIPNSDKATVVGNRTYSLKVGNNDITLSVTAENGITENYKVRVVRDASDNDDLDFLYVHEGGLQPIFNETTIYYEVKVPNDATIPLNIEAITEDENATYEIIGNDGTLEVGVAKEIIVRVTAQKGNKKDYTLSVTRQAATEENLALESLITNRGEVQPTFSPDTLNYTLEVENEISDIEVTGTALSENVTVKGNGTYNLNVGKNAIPIFVVGTDGVQRDYQIVVTRKKSKDASLANLVVKSHTLTPTFTSGTTSYSLTTSNTSLEFTTITPTEAEATYEIIGNENFTTGENTVTIRVTAPDGETTQDYVLTVTRTGSKNNNLASLSVEGYTLTPNFHKGVTFYAVEVANNLNSIIINATAEDASATITGDGLQVITTGENYFDIVVTSETGATKTYTILVTKEASDNNYLASLYTSTGDLTPDFDKLENKYEMTVPYETEEIEIYGYVEDLNATVTGIKQYNLNVGENTIKVIVTSESGIENIYEIKVTREEINSANLLDLTIQNYELDSEFNKDLLEYYITVDSNITSLNISYIKEDQNAKVEITGNEDFVVGMNEVKILVTASDGVTTKEYIVYVNRQLSTNNYLEYIITDKGTLNPVFNPLTLSYSISVDSDIESITIDARPQDSASTITSGVGTHTLNKGDNKIEIKVKSMVGVTRTYIVNVYREKNSNNNLLNLEVLHNNNELTLTPNFSNEIYNYEINVSSEVNYVDIVATKEDASASVSGTGIKVLNSGLNTFIVTVTAEDGSPKDYTINITREKSTNNNVLNIIPSVGTFTETFDPDIKEYTLKVSETDLFLDFEVELEDINASVIGNERQAIPNGTSERVITVTAEDGSINEYTITVIKENISEARLESLEIKDYELEFNPDTFTYNVSVSGAKRELLASEITAIPKDSDATVNLMGNIKLAQGIINVYTIEVIAQDGYTTQEYTLNITRDSELHTLRSDIYEITRDDEEDYVTKINVTKLENFKNSFQNENEYLKVYKDTTEIIDEVNIGTGYIIKLEINGIVYDTLRIMVTGDVTGDGKVDVSDSVDLNNVILKKKVFEGITFKAGDVTGDGKIDVSDSVKLNNYILKKIASLVNEES